jgi:sulfur-carrier protein
MRVRIPTPLRSYTKAANVTADGPTLGDVLVDLDRQFPGLRFRVIDEQGRIRKHMRLFVNDDIETDLTRVLRPTDEVTVMQALSGG